MYNDSLYTCVMIYLLPNCVTCPNMNTDPECVNPVWGEDKYWDLYEYWGGWPSFVKTYLISIMTEILKIVLLLPFRS